MGLNIKPVTPLGGSIAPERLFLSRDRKTILRDGEGDPAFLLCGKGQPVPERYREQYKAWSESKPEQAPPPQTTQEQTTQTESAPFENRETKVVDNLRKRKRGKQDKAD